MPKQLHIICLTVPYPVNYGGVFDLFYKLVYLHGIGISIHLHCFDYGRGEQPELEKYCANVYYYPRRNWWQSLSANTPYMVKSRNHPLLVKRLLQDDNPILMEGVHCTYLLNDDRFTNRDCYVRLHNVEQIYYRHLFKNDRNIAKKLYFLAESVLLQKYEKQIAKKATFISVTEKDAEVYRAMGANNAIFLPVFLPRWEVADSTGCGSFCLYHGDLSVAENEYAAIWLLTQVFEGTDLPFVIAGKNPTKQLHNLVESRTTACLIANPSEKEMQDLIAKAQINILPSFNATGIKLKLINALYNGRHCLVNDATVQGSGLSKACHLAESAIDFRQQIINLFTTPYTECQATIRKTLLDNLFDNQQNALRLMAYIWKSHKPVLQKENVI